MAVTAIRAGARPREFVGVTGPDSESLLQALLTADVEALAPGDSRQALLLTPKARVIAPMFVLRRSHEDFLLLTEPGLGVPLRAALLRARFAARCKIELEEHRSTVVLGGSEGIPTDEYGVEAVEVLDADLEPTLEGDELERLRIRAGTPRWGRELDDRVLPAEAGLDVRAIDFEKGCFPGQEPVARQRYRGRVNRTLRRLAIAGEELPPYDAELVHEGKAVGRLTSAVRDEELGVIGLGYVRVEVPAEAELAVGGRRARPLDLFSGRP